MGVTFQDRLPVDWQVLPSVPGDPELRNFSDSNTRLLQAFNLLDEQPGEPEEGVDGESPENRRLEAKLDFLMAMLGELLAAQVGVPAPRPVVVGATHLRIVDPGRSGPPVPSVGECLVLRLFLDARFPKPLQFPCVVCEPEPSTGDGLVVRLLGVSEPLQAELEKLVFRHHRRAVASTRRHGKLPEPR